MTTETQAPQNEGGEGQTGAPDKTYTQSEVDKLIDKVRSVDREKLDKREKQLDKLRTTLATRDVEVGDLQRQLSDFQSSDFSQQLQEKDAALADARGTIAKYRNSAIAGKVAGELAADAGVVATLIAGLRSQGLPDAEPEDDNESAQFWAGALREKHGALFEQPPKDETPAQASSPLGIVPQSGSAAPDYSTAQKERSKTLKSMGFGNALI